ncbi:MAG: hypothetical protein J6Q61_06735 [Bacteroidales bacterium]|nr:hypothetical protein [Bacteroidales bacterium]
MSKQLPTKWVLGWSGNIELGFDDGKYLPRKPALILYPEYFDEQGNPIKDKLPFDKPKERGEGEVKIIKALLFTVLLFIIAIAMCSLPVLFGGIGAMCMLGIVFLIIFIALFCSL